MSATEAHILEQCILRVEHDHITLRNPTGWLLWSGKISDGGVRLGDITPQITENNEYWRRVVTGPRIPSSETT